MKSKKPTPLGSFEAAGPIEWAILAPVSADELHALVIEAWSTRIDVDDDEPQSWGVVPGTKRYAAVIETEPGSTSTERELALALSKKLGATVYTVGFCGYDDPDRGLPYIERYEAGNPLAKTVPGPRGVPCDDPFDFADALGCALRAFARK
jgi:hypothetical protein